VGRAVDAALGSLARPVVVVLGANAEAVAAELAGRPVILAHNPDWASGMASSIRTGIAAVLGAAPGIDAILLTPCDQPALSAAVITELAELHRASGRVAAARYGGRNGAPAVFGRGHFSTLSALSGDEGARRLLNASAEAVVAVDLPQFAEDIDTPADFEAWKKRAP
jgi:molybdenum cofactor cytidylyltransferase